MKKLLFGSLTFTLIVMSACNKEKNDAPSGGSASIQGNWAVSSVLTVESGFDPVTYQGKPDDYYKFGTDGNVAVKVDEFVTTVAYTMVDATHVNIGGDVEEIKELTAHKLVLHSPATDDAPEDETITLIK